MKVSFNGLRKNLCRCFNEVSENVKQQNSYPRDCEKAFLKEEFEEKFNELGSHIGAFLCIYEPNIDGDFDDLSEVCLIDFLGEE